MRILHSLACVSVAFSLAACATAGPKPGEHPVRAPEGAGYGNYLNARLAANQHDLKSAAKFYRASLKDDPNNDDLLARAFLYSASAGEMDQAVALARKVVVSDPDNRAARTTLAVYELRQKDYGDVHKELAQSATGPFTALTIALLNAWADAGQNKTDAALAELEKLKGQGGADAIAAFQKALVLELAGRNAEAGDAYREALKLGGKGPRLVDAYGRFLERNGQAAEARAFYAGLGNDLSVAPIVQAATRRMAAGKVPAPLAADPQEGAAEALFGVAASLTDDASADVSVLYLHYARYLRPSLDLADILLADRFESLQKYRDAISLYDSIGKDSPYYGVTQVQVALNLSRLDDNDGAIAKLKAVVADDPNNVEAWTALGDIYRGAEKYREAADAYDHAIRVNGGADAKTWPLLYARAAAYESSGRWTLAEADLKHALKLSPDEPQLLNFLGYSWVDRGENLQEALAMLEKARALRPFDGYITDSVGWAYYRLGRYKDAATALESAVLLVPGDPTINDHYGDALWRVGRKRDARFQWNHALSFGPDAQEKTRIESKLKHGLESVEHKS